MTIMDVSDDKIKIPDVNYDTLSTVSYNSPTMVDASRVCPRFRSLRTIAHLVGWWWELGSILVSLACMSLITAILFSMDGKPTRIWSLPIQPNSLIAVFSTLARSALLVSVSESLGQLKWHFFARPRKLEHMQTFDEATRGPWGAAMFVWKMWDKSWLAASGAVIVVLLLAMEPFTQQIIEVHSKRDVMGDVTGFVSVAEGFEVELSGKYLGEGRLPKDVYLAMTNGMFDAISGKSTSFLNNSYCPTLECAIEDFTSLAICSFCESKEVHLGKDADGCSYEIQKGYPLDRMYNAYRFPPFLTNKTIRGPFRSHSEFRRAVSEVDKTNVLLRSCEIADGNETLVNLTFQVTPEHFEPHGFSFDWTDQHTNITQKISNLPIRRRMVLSWGSTSRDNVIGGGTVRWLTGDDRPVMFSLEDNPYTPEDMLSACVVEHVPSYDTDTNEIFTVYWPNATSIAMATCFTSSSNLTAMEQVDHFGEITGTITSCRPTFCARRYHDVKITPTGVRADSTTDFPFTDHTDVDAITIQVQLKLNDTRTFNISSGSLKDVFARTLRSNAFTYNLSAQLPQSGRDWEGLFKLISDVLTQGMQGPWNKKATRIHGPAYGTEICIRVRWIWFMLPMLLVLAANVFVIAVMLRSRESLGLYKNSILAVLFHGSFADDMQSARGAKSTANEGDSVVVKDLGGIRASFGRDENGYLRLRRE